MLWPAIIAFFFGLLSTALGLAAHAPRDWSQPAIGFGLALLLFSGLWWAGWTWMRARP